MLGWLGWEISRVTCTPVTCPAPQAWLPVLVPMELELRYGTDGLDRILASPSPLVDDFTPQNAEPALDHRCKGLTTKRYLARLQYLPVLLCEIPSARSCLSETALELSCVRRESHSLARKLAPAVSGHHRTRRSNSPAGGPDLLCWRPCAALLHSCLIAGVVLLLRACTRIRPSWRCFVCCV